MNVCNNKDKTVYTNIGSTTLGFLTGHPRNPYKITPKPF